MCVRTKISVERCRLLPSNGTTCKTQIQTLHFVVPFVPRMRTQYVCSFNHGLRTAHHRLRQLLNSSYGVDVYATIALKAKCLRFPHCFRDSTQTAPHLSRGYYTFPNRLGVAEWSSQNPFNNILHMCNDLPSDVSSSSSSIKV